MTYCEKFNRMVTECDIKKICMALVVLGNVMDIMAMIRHLKFVLQ